MHKHLWGKKYYQHYRYSKKQEESSWHSWDPHPWDYPWLNRENLEQMKAYSQQVLESEKKVLETCDPRTLDVGFCGNIANAMYVRAKPLRRAGMKISIYIHPSDNYVMSQPGWEEFDGSLPEGVTDINELNKLNIFLPDVPDIYKLPQVDITEWYNIYKKYGYNFLNEEDIQKFLPYLCLVKTLCELQPKDALWCTQSVYMGYLSKRPYLASQSGGDLWLETSRGDMLGELMRCSFGSARLLLASNPWSFAHARRLGYKQMIYLPKVLDEHDYKPGNGESRKAWEKASGGNFFVLTTSRFDEKNKGSSIGLKGFAAFSNKFPDARLVFVGWGNDAVKLESELEKKGLSGKVIRMPVSGKIRLCDYLRSADVFIDQFTLGYFGSAGMEAMACGLPLIGRIEDEQYDALCETGAPPIINCSNADEVAAGLERLAINKQYRLDLARNHRDWFVRNHGSERWKEEYMAVLAATARRLPLNFEQSPLDSDLDVTEWEYLRNGLEVAPPHLEYGW